MSNFDPNAILRGAQLTLVGGVYQTKVTVVADELAYRSLQNPSLFNNKHYSQAAIAVLAGVAIRIIIEIPV